MKYSAIILTVLLITSCATTEKKTNQNNLKNTERMTTKNKEIVNVALVYLKEGKQNEFNQYKKQ